MYRRYTAGPCETYVINCSCHHAPPGLYRRLDMAASVAVASVCVWGGVFVRVCVCVCLCLCVSMRFNAEQSRQFQSHNSNDPNVDPTTFPANPVQCTETQEKEEESFSLELHA